jgi:hypothetical protein
MVRLTFLLAIRVESSLLRIPPRSAGRTQDFQELQRQVLLATAGDAWPLGWQFVLEEGGELSVSGSPIDSRLPPRPRTRQAAAPPRRRLTARDGAQTCPMRSKLLSVLHSTFSLPARHSRRIILAMNSSWLCGPDARFSRMVVASSARSGKRSAAASNLIHPFG